MTPGKQQRAVLSAQEHLKGPLQRSCYLEMHAKHKIATQKKSPLCVCSEQFQQLAKHPWGLARLVGEPLCHSGISDSSGTLLFQPRLLFGRLLTSSCPEGRLLTSCFKGYRFLAFPFMPFPTGGFCSFLPKGCSAQSRARMSPRCLRGSWCEEMTGCVWYGTGVVVGSQGLGWRCLGNCFFL